MDEMNQSDTGQPAQARQTKNIFDAHRRRITALFVFTILAVIGAVIVYFYLQYKSTHISTDDAFVEGDVYTIASKVPGTAKTVFVKANQFVKTGEVLVELDSSDYEMKVKEAAAAANSEKGKIVEIDAKVVAAKRQLSEFQARANAVKAVFELQKANLEQAESDAGRAEGLFKKDAISKERYEKAMTARKVAVAQLKAAQENVRNMQLSVETQKALIRQAEAARGTQLSEVKRREAQLGDAELKYGYTKLLAPADGYVTKKNVEIGNQIQAGQPLMAVVSLDDIHIIANYKETQLEKIKPGQKVEIKVDTYSGKKFKGKVDSIMAGTGAAFSLFPPENATGNYVKVVQRIPVKIVLEQNADPEHVLRIGMSVEPTIIVK